MQSDAATIGEISQPVAGSTARGDVTIVVAFVGMGAGTGRVTSVGLGALCRSSLRQKPLQMEKTAGVSAEFDLVDHPCNTVTNDTICRHEDGL